MLKKSVEKALNDHVNWEFYSAYLYLSMSSYCEEINLPGFASWMYVQYQEEMAHAQKMFRYINEARGRATLQAIQEPPAEWNSPVHVFEETLKHEEEVTAKINSLTDLALKERDHATNALLQWFITEQVEEESTVSTILEQLKRVEDSKDGMFMLDRELGQRTFTDPTAGTTP